MVENDVFGAERSGEEGVGGDGWGGGGGGLLTSGSRNISLSASPMVTSSLMSCPGAFTPVRTPMRTPCRPVPGDDGGVEPPLPAVRRQLVLEVDAEGGG